MTYEDGRRAAQNREPISACPWAPADPDGLSWRQGWIEEEAFQRVAEGTFGASADEHAAAIRSFGKALNPDPFPELLADEQPEPYPASAFYEPACPVVRFKGTDDLDSRCRGIDEVVLTVQQVVADASDWIRRLAATWGDALAARSTRSVPKAWLPLPASIVADVRIPPLDLGVSCDRQLVVDDIDACRKALGDLVTPPDLTRWSGDEPAFSRGGGWR